MSKSIDDSWQIRRASIEEWQVAIDWAHQEGWDLGAHDQMSFYNADPYGFFIAYLNNQPVASISIVNHSSTYAHVGHYLVDPKRRGEGWGLRTWNAALEHAGDRVLGCDGMLTQEANYRKSGLIPYYRTLRFNGAVTKAFAVAKNAFQVCPENLGEIVAYDEACLGVQRKAFLTDWFTGPGRSGYITTSEGRITGLVGIRPSTEGYRLGPWYADETSSMLALLETALAQLPIGARVTIDVPETSQDSLRLAADMGFEELFSTIRMYRGAAPGGNQSNVKAIATLELG